MHPKFVRTDPPIIVTQPEPGVGLVEIFVPPANALGSVPRAALLAALDALEADLAIRVIILTGRGQAFCSGDDLREASQRNNASADAPSLGSFGAVLDRIEEFRVPVIAAVNGYAIGGGLELALSCDIRIAAESARFQGAGVNVGLMASVYRLPRLIGVARAKAMLLTGLPADAATALTYGLVTEVHAADALMPAALAMAGRIATRAPLSVEASKRQIGRAFDMDAEQAQAASVKELSVLAKSQDHKAAVEAFLTRATPVFTRS